MSLVRLESKNKTNRKALILEQFYFVFGKWGMSLRSTNALTNTMLMAGRISLALIINP
jgi:hypothetical protein